MKGWLSNRSSPFRELIFTESVRLLQTSLHASFVLFTNENFYPGRSTQQHQCWLNRRFQSSSPHPTNFSLLLWKSSLLVCTFVALPLKIKTCSPYRLVYPSALSHIYSSCFHDAETNVTTYIYFNYFFKISLIKLWKFPIVLYLFAGGLPINCHAFTSRQEASVWKGVPESQVRNYKPCVYLSSAVSWRSH